MMLLPNQRSERASIIEEEGSEGGSVVEEEGTTLASLKKRVRPAKQRQRNSRKT